jgi:hypothetical protein
VIGKTIRGQSAGERCAVRQESTKPLALFNADRIAEGGDLRAEARVARNGEQAKTVNAAAGATRLEPGPKGTRKSRLFSFSKRARQRSGGTLKRFPADLNRGDSQGLIDERIFVH